MILRSSSCVIGFKIVQAAAVVATAVISGSVATVVSSSLLIHLYVVHIEAAVI